MKNSLLKIPPCLFRSDYSVVHQQRLSPIVSCNLLLFLIFVICIFFLALSCLYLLILFLFRLFLYVFCKLCTIFQNFTTKCICTYLQSSYYLQNRTFVKGCFYYLPSILLRANVLLNMKGTLFCSLCILFLQQILN